MTHVFKNVKKLSTKKLRKELFVYFLDLLNCNPNVDVFGGIKSLLEKGVHNGGLTSFEAMVWQDIEFQNNFISRIL